MGSWGECPWESDAGINAASVLMRDLFKQIWIGLSKDVLPGNTSDVDRAKVYCDLVIRLSPYWRDPSNRQEAVQRAIVVMEQVLSALAAEEIDEPNNEAMLRELRRMQSEAETY